MSFADYMKRGKEHGFMKISIKKISELTGYSPATVSNAISGRRTVSKEASDRILEAAREHGFLDHMQIKKIKFVNFKNSGTICTDTPFFTAVIEGVTKESQRLGYEVTLCTLSRQQKDYEAALEQLLNETGCAILLLATEMSPEDARPFESFAGPLVMLDCSMENMKFHTVYHSNTESMMQATEYLIACGHQNIGYLAGNIRIKNFLDRQTGYECVLARHGIALNPDHQFLLTPTVEGSYIDMNERLLSCRDLPTAFIADNDNIALGAIRALKQHGYKIPDEISVIGFDDVPFCTISAPALTTIHVHKEKLGQIALKRLAELIPDPDKDVVRTKIQVCNELVVRDSVKRL